MFVEALFQALSLNWGWFIEVTLNNLFWVFGFLAGAWFFREGKGVLGFFIIIIASIWLWFDFANVTGWVVFTGVFLSVLYIVRTAILMFAEDTEWGKNNLPLIYSGFFFVWLIIYNNFFR